MNTPSESALRRALRRAEQGAALDPVEAEVLLHARGEHLQRLVAAAGRQRDAGLAAAGRAGLVTYSRKVFIPLTRLCRDRCHYCTFVATPGQLRSAGHGMYLSPDEVLDIARRGADLGCREALFTLGDRPEDRWPAAREWLESHGYDSTLAYVRAMAVRVLEETGLLPHLNPGVLSWDELARLKPVAASMGMMLETTSTRLFTEPGGAHFGSPDKDPAVRLRVIEDAGRQSIPFTTGILVGIGETLAERVDSLFAIRRLARAYGHVQEVIVQNFRAKADTAMRSAPDAEPQDYLATVAVARLVLGSKMRVQVPPNLSDPDALAALLAAGADDWGGVSPLTPDHVNPERPWPHLEDLTAWTAAAGFALTERLAAQPEYVRRGEPWIDARVRPHVAALADANGLANVGVQPHGLPWQEPDGGYSAFAERAGGGRVDLFATVDTTGRTGDRRGDFDEVYGDWTSVSDAASAASAVVARSAVERLDGDVRAALALAADDPAALAASGRESLALALFHADGPGLAALARVADDVRRDTVGDRVSYVVNRNVNFTNVCYVGCRFCAFAQRRTDADAYTLSLEQVGDRVAEAWDLGATEVCIQGGIHPDLPGTAYFDLAREVKRRVPEMHLHAFSPMEVMNGATRSGLSVREWLSQAKAAGLDTIPGTAAEILDDEVRWVLTKGKLPTAAWVDVVRTAHSLGIRSSATMMYGHVDAPEHWYRHLLLLRRLQSETGGFTEFVPLPFVHHNAPVYLAGVARPGPTRRDNIAVHAMARLLLHGAIDHVQTSWVKLSDDGVRTMLGSGVDDLGGTLMEETISRMAGSENGSQKSVRELEALIRSAGREPVQRTTTYGTVAPERREAALRSDGVLPTVTLLPLATAQAAAQR
ncbi:MAG TPA: bifunctional FO biosynthesis protein CofGH [Actinomycetes bacterium]|nr:bifunctional FO biosynthesis protein CofGH [Actinomycetes bacterium]